MTTEPTTTVEIWVLVDAIGDAAIGLSETEVEENFENNLNTHHGGRRLLKLLLTVPLPQPQELTATIPSDNPAPAQLQIA